MIKKKRIIFFVSFVFCFSVITNICGDYEDISYFEADRLIKSKDKKNNNYGKKVAIFLGAGSVSAALLYFGYKYYNKLNNPNEKKVDDNNLTTTSGGPEKRNSSNGKKEKTEVNQQVSQNKQGNDEASTKGNGPQETNNQDESTRRNVQAQEDIGNNNQVNASPEQHKETNLNAKKNDKSKTTVQTPKVKKATDNKDNTNQSDPVNSNSEKESDSQVVLDSPTDKMDETNSTFIENLSKYKISENVNDQILTLIEPFFSHLPQLFIHYVNQYIHLLSDSGTLMNFLYTITGKRKTQQTEIKIPENSEHQNFYQVIKGFMKMTNSYKNNSKQSFGLFFSNINALIGNSNPLISLQDNNLSIDTSSVSLLPFFTVILPKDNNDINDLLKLTIDSSSINILEQENENYKNLMDNVLEKNDLPKPDNKETQKQDNSKEASEKKETENVQKKSENKEEVLKTNEAEVESSIFDNLNKMLFGKVKKIDKLNNKILDDTTDIIFCLNELIKFYNDLFNGQRKNKVEQESNLDLVIVALLSNIEKDFDKKLHIEHEDIDDNATDQKKAEQEIKEHKNYIDWLYHKILNDIHDLKVDKQGKVVLKNQEENLKSLKINVYTLKNILYLMKLNNAIKENDDIKTKMQSITKKVDELMEKEGINNLQVINFGKNFLEFDIKMSEDADSQKKVLSAVISTINSDIDNFDKIKSIGLQTTLRDFLSKINVEIDDDQ